MSGSLPPWIEHPFQLVTWMEILKFSAFNFYKTANMLAVLTKVMEGFKPEERTQPIPDYVQESISKMAKEIRDYCGEISLSMSVLSAKRLEEAAKNAETWERLRELHEELNGRIRDEIKSNLFLFVPQSHATLYDAINPFGEEVDSAFPSASYDITEAGKCLALHRGTACVFHCMRVLERGLYVLAGVFNVARDHANWQGMIDRIQAAVGRIRLQKNKPPDWRANEQYYSEAASQFMHFKNAWRNYTAHASFKYTEDEAEPIYRHVRDFMRHLSKRLKEPSLEQAQ